jgi:alpha-beta hydrolase superfamily lysophospholipase
MVTLLLSAGLAVTGDSWRTQAARWPAFDSAVACGLPKYRSLYGLDKALGRHRVGWLWTGHQRIVAQRFEVAQPRGTALIVHGYLDHSAIQAPLIVHLNKSGWSVLAIDLPGHGLSPGRRASLTRFDSYRASLRVALDSLVADSTLPPPYLAIGHSTGAAVLLDTLLLDGAPMVDEVVLLAPLIRWANWRLSRIGQGLAGAFVDRVPRAFRNTTHDPKFRNFRSAIDPLQPTHIPLAWARVMARHAEVVVGRTPVSRPVTVIQGSGDRTVDWRYNRAALKRLLPGASWQLIAGARHHLQHETKRFRAPLFEALSAIMARVRRN